MEKWSRVWDSALREEMGQDATLNKVVSIGLTEEGRSERRLERDGGHLNQASIWEKNIPGRRNNRSMSSKLDEQLEDQYSYFRGIKRSYDMRGNHSKSGANLACIHRTQ